MRCAFPPYAGWRGPRYINAQLIFRSNEDKEWRDATGDGGCIQQKVSVPPYGMVLLREGS